jgi:uncharacterized membrane protein YoaK (UPF0700 family)
MPEGGPEPADAPEADRSRLFPIALAVTGGFTDAFGFLTLHGLLTAHVTGNLVFLAVGLAQGGAHIIMKLLALPLFMAGVGLTTVFITWAGRRSGLTLAWSLLAEACLFLLCLAAGMLLPPCRSTDDLTGCCVGTLLILAMGAQNAIMRLPLKRLPPTTAMTGNVAEATVQWTHWLVGFQRLPSPEQRRKLFGRAKTIGVTVGAFALGAIGGGLAAVGLGYKGLIVPICILAALAVYTVFSRRMREPAGEAALGD